MRQEHHLGLIITTETTVLQRPQPSNKHMICNLQCLSSSCSEMTNSKTKTLLTFLSA